MKRNRIAKLQTAPAISPKPLSMWLVFRPNLVVVGIVLLGSSVLSSFSQNYPGQETNAAWRAAAASRIEQHRKANVTVVVTDSTGQPVPGAQIEVRMKRHAFGFGSAVATQRMLGSDDDSVMYRNLVKKLFSKVVMEYDLQWGSWENNRMRGWSGVQWLRQEGFPLRGHNLVWPGWDRMPADVQTLASNPAALRARIDNHVTELVRAFRGQLVEWDVLNEPYSEHDVMDVLGSGEMVRWFQLAREADPNAVLYLNDYNVLENNDTGHRNAFMNTARYLLTNGAPLGGLGLQGHFGTTLTGIDELYTRLDQFSTLGLPLQVTEFDIAHTNEVLQADYMRDFMTIVFSHPSVTGIVMWGFWEGRHWRPTAALYRQDWSIKPNGIVWNNLVLTNWWTTDIGTAAIDGVRTIRAFKGDYVVRVTGNGRTHEVNVPVYSHQLVSVVLGEAPEVSFTSPALGAIALAGVPTSLMVTVSDADNAVRSVEYLVDGEIVAMSTEAPYAASWTPASVGYVSLSARAVDVSGLESVATMLVKVEQAPQVSVGPRIDENFRLTVRKEPGQEAILLHSTNLLNWSALTTNVTSATNFVFNHANALTRSHGFYRAGVRSIDLKPGLLPELVSYWPLDAMDGAGVSDVRGGNHLFLNRLTQTNIVAGRFGGALALNGIDQFAGLYHAGDHGLPAYSQKYTIAFWVKGNPGQADRRIFAEASDTSPTPIFDIGSHQSGTDGAADIFMRNDDNTYPHNHSRSFAAILDGQWHHVAWVDTGGAVAFYVDGVRDGRNFNYTPGQLTPNTFALGALLRNSTGSYFAGAIDEVAVWHRALSAGEVLAVRDGQLRRLFAIP